MVQQRKGEDQQGGVEVGIMIIINCFLDGGKDGWGRCFINEGRWWLARVGCRASLVVGRWFRVLFSVAKSIWVEVGAGGYGSSKRFEFKERPELNSSSK